MALVGYCCLSLQNVEIAGKIQLYMLIFAIGGCIVATVAFLFSGVWSLDNFKNFFYSQVGSQFGIPSWFIGMALLITPFFGFETVPQMVEEGDFPIKDSNKGDPWIDRFLWSGVYTVLLRTGRYAGTVSGRRGRRCSERIPGHHDDGAVRRRLEYFAVIFGVAAILCAIGTCLLGFWLVYSSSDVCHGREQLPSKGIYEIKPSSAAGASEYFIADHIFDLFTFTERYHIL